MPQNIEPHSIEAEQVLIGSVLVDNEAYHVLGTDLRAEHFYDPVHEAIWKNITGRIAKDHLASPITVAADFEGNDGLKDLGGSKYLVRMAAMSRVSDANNLAEMVVNLAEKRRILGYIRNVEHDLTHGGELGASVAELEMMLHETIGDTADPRSMSFLRAQMEAIGHMQQINEGETVSVPTGISALDDLVTFAPKRYTILGGSTSMGKSALAIWLTYAAAKQGYGVGFDSLEMPETDIANRLNSIESRVPYKAMDRPQSDNVFHEVIEAARRLEAMPVEIFSDRVRDVPSILSEAKRLKHKWQPNDKFKGLRLLVVDYLQLVRGKGESQFVRLSQVANDLKQVAKMLDVHVLALAQVDRKISASDDYKIARPKLAHLRGSGDLENAPDNVIFIHRPEYYLKRQTPPDKPEDRADWEQEVSSWAGKAEIIVEKARMGDIGVVQVGCDLATNRFWDLEDNQGDIEF